MIKELEAKNTILNPVLLLYFIISSFVFKIAVDSEF